jgi:outer membrane protein TolC
MRIASRCFLTVGFALLCVVHGASADTISNPPPVVELSLNAYLHVVLQKNESLQAQMLEAEVSRRKQKGAYGAFEPLFEASVEHVINQRTNDVQQQAALSGQGSFSERNNIYDTGIESLLPTGAKIRLGYTLSDFYNNASGNPFTPTVTNFTRQYETFIGATFTQPLLKDGGFSTTLAELRLAAMDSDIAFQEYRRQLMLTVSRAESAYWNLYYAQQQLQFFDESVAVAQDVLSDSQEKVHSGQGAELDVMESQSDLALRETRRNEALQSYFDAIGTMELLAGGTLIPRIRGLGEAQLRAVDAPAATNAPVSFFDAAEQAMDLNPDYLIEIQKMHQEEVRLGVAKNQVLPQLDFKAAYGYNGLGFSPSASWNVAASENYPSWSVGLELIIPMAGNIKNRNLLHANEIGLQEAYLNLKGAQDEIANRLDTALHKSGAWEQSIHSCQTVVHYNEELLQTELERLKAGSVDGHKVLEVEADLLDSRQELANSLVQYRDSLLELELASGALLKHRNLDITRNELKQQTASFMDDARKADETF